MEPSADPAPHSPLPSPGETRRIEFNRRRAIVRAERIDVRPSRGAIVPPLLGFLLGALCLALIVWGVVADTLPYWLLALLLLFALVAVPLAGITLVYAVFGANVVFDRAKQSGTWQQGFLGMGIGTTELVPFWKIAAIEVAETGRGDGDRPPSDAGDVDENAPVVEEFVQWEVALLKQSGKRLRIAGMTVPRPFARGGFAEVHELGCAIAALTGAPLHIVGPEPPAPDATEPTAPPEPEQLRPSVHRRSAASAPQRRRARRR
ncbi:MAG TPA: hypothetical protein VH916_00210 [Dehalococcoidia bacterium]|jgi:hypothetical protein